MPDLDPEAMRAEIWSGLTSEPRRLSSRWFYDHRGSELFEAITRLPEYYPTRTEQALLESWAELWMERMRAVSLVELGAGSARKTRILLDAMTRGAAEATYLPLDVSSEFLECTASDLRGEYPRLTVRPLVGDLTRPLALPDLPRPLAVAFLGGTLGNFTPDAAVDILRNVRAVMRSGDALLLGADLRPGPGKSVDELEAAYDDAGGVTAEFNRNILRALNRRAGTDFDPDAFEHRAFYEPTLGRIEMYLEARVPQTVRVPGQGAVRVEAGERVRTEISCKYDRPTLDALLTRAGLAVAEWASDDAGRYALIQIVRC